MPNGSGSRARPVRRRSRPRATWRFVSTRSKGASYSTSQTRSETNASSTTGRDEVMNASTPVGKNNRILVIDDNRAIHDDFRKILSPATATAAALDAAEAAVFGRSTDAVRPTEFEVDSAY